MEMLQTFSSVSDNLKNDKDKINSKWRFQFYFIILKYSRLKVNFQFECQFNGEIQQFFFHFFADQTYFNGCGTKQKNQN